MSILLAAVSSTTLPAAAAAAPENISSAATAILLGWAGLGLLIIYLIGAFRPASVVGPERLVEDESGFDLLALICAAIGAHILGMLSVVRWFHLDQTMTAIVADIAGKTAGILAIIIAMSYFRIFNLKKIGLDPWRLGAGIACGAATLFVLYPLISITSLIVESALRTFHLRQPDAHEVLKILGNRPSRWLKIGTIALAVIFAPVFEELFFRGLLQTALGRLFSWLGILSTALGSTDAPLPTRVPAPSSTSRWLAIVVTAAAFAAIHMVPAFFIPLFVLAVGLGYIYERTGNLWITITAHAMFNGAQILIYLTAK